MKYFYIIAAVIMFFGGFVGAVTGISVTNIVMLLVGGWCLFKGIQADRNEQRLRLNGSDDERTVFLRESYEKAVADHKAIETARRSIGDAELSRVLSEMQQMSGRMLRYLEKNPDRLPMASKFIDYYQDRAAHLANKYAELEETGVNTADVSEMKDRVKAALSDMQNAYAEQFAAVLNDRLIDMDAELKVLSQTMRDDGIGKRRISLGKPGEAVGTLPSPQPSRRNFSAGELSIIPPTQRTDVMFTKIVQSGLAIFLGGFGAHKFYQGKTFQGVLYVLFCWTAIPSFIGFCEGLKYLFMKLDDFYVDYYEKRR